ncbi:MAG: site-2 protease family protein [Puniceicoccales bacterium]|jgi:Zn-dependent protease|nr:site-2 protease family protein [Puniceicoccales bacterium]
MEVQDLKAFFVCYLWFLLAITIHEWGHAWIASRLGDDTPRIEGRVTLNPLAHISFWGTFVIPLVMFLSPSKIALLGWGRPVTINSDNFKYKKLGDVLCSLAGPLLNFILGLCVLLLGFAVKDKHQSLSHLCLIGTKINVSLGLFNLIPIPPLDGAHILKIIIMMKEGMFVLFSEVGSFLLLILINVPLFKHYFSEASHFLLDLYWKFGKLLFG